METTTKVAEIMENRTFNWEEEKNRVIVDCIENLDNDDLLELDREYKIDTYLESIIYPIEELNELYGWLKPLEILSACKDVNADDDYIVYTIYGWESGDIEHMRDNYIYTTDIAEWMQRGEECYNDELKHQIKEEFLLIVKYLLGNEMMEYIDDNVTEEEVITEDWEELLTNLCKQKEEEYEEQIEEININNI